MVCATSRGGAPAQELPLLLVLLAEEDCSDVSEEDEGAAATVEVEIEDAGVDVVEVDVDEDDEALEKKERSDAPRDAKVAADDSWMGPREVQIVVDEDVLLF